MPLPKLDKRLTSFRNGPLLRSPPPSTALRKLSEKKNTCCFCDSVCDSVVTQDHILDPTGFFSQACLERFPTSLCAADRVDDLYRQYVRAASLARDRMWTRQDMYV